MINKENGIIHGKIDKEIEKREYEITCNNIYNDKNNLFEYKKY